MDDSNMEFEDETCSTDIFLDSYKPKNNPDDIKREREIEIHDTLEPELLEREKNCRSDMLHSQRERSASRLSVNGISRTSVSYLATSRCNTLINPVQQILKDWNLEKACERFRAANFDDINDLKIITESDLNTMFPAYSQLSIKCRLRARLSHWRRYHGYPVISPEISLRAAETYTSIQFDMPSPELSAEQHIISADPPEYRDRVNPEHENSLTKNSTIASATETAISRSEPLNSSIGSWIDVQPMNSPSSSVSVATTIHNSSHNCKSMFDFTEFLDSTQGKKIINMYSRNSGFDEDTRAILINSIVQEMINNNVVMTPTDLERVSFEIAKAFPGENSELYYKQHARGITSGKLCNSYRNKVCKFKKLGLFTSPKGNSVKRKIHTKVDYVPPKMDKLLNEHFLNDKNYLIKSFDQNQEPWERIEIKWKDTVKGRQAELRSLDDDKYILTFIDDWPLLKFKFGYKLVDIEFNELYPGKSRGLYSRLDVFYNAAPVVFLKRIKDKKYKELLMELPENEDMKMLALLKILAYCLKPTNRRAPVNKDANNIWRPSVDESISAVVVEAANIVALQNMVEAKKAKYLKYDLTLQPFIAILDTYGERKFAVKYESIYYTFDSFLPCLDICFKLYFVLNLNFPFECNKVWQFIQVFFFEINSDCPEVQCLVDEFNFNK